MRTIDEISSELDNGKLILFVGAGVSMNLGLPSWSSLIDYMAQDLGYEQAVFRAMGNYMELAEFYKLKKGTIGPLRSWMDVHFHAEHIDITSSKVHRLIVELDFPIIYTTNYDRWLERAYVAYGKDHDKIKNIFDLTQNHEGRPQIIKYHGDFDDDASIVLTETSYFQRLSLDTPLDVKLRADTLGKSILFIGYSLGDIDIRYLLYKLQLLWGDDAEHAMRPKSYIFLGKRGEVQEKILTNRGIECIYSEIGDPGEALADFLSSLKKEENRD